MSPETSPSKKILDELSHELRLLGCMVRANMRDHTQQLSDTLETRELEEDEVRSFDEKVTTILGDLEVVFGAYRALQDALRNKALPQDTLEVYDYVDEYLSLSLDNYLTFLVERIDDVLSNYPTLKSSRQKLCYFLLEERKHQVGRNYTNVHEDAPRNEYYVYRRGILKKFTMSALFLEYTKEREGARVADLSAAVAAGIAMLFASMAAIYSQQRYGVNTLPFVGALVISYILKDRIKDWLKQYFSSKMTRFLVDYKVDLRDPNNDVTVGLCREAFAFVKHDRVPTNIIETRHPQGRNSIEARSKPEVVMKYEKDVELNGSVIGNHHSRLNDINDIIRFNISAFLNRADDPVAKIATYDAASDEISAIACRKVYHINVIFVLRAHQSAEEPRIHRVRVVMDKNGIRRIEHAGNGGGNGPHHA